MELSVTTKLIGIKWGRKLRDFTFLLKGIIVHFETLITLKFVGLFFFVYELEILCMSQEYFQGKKFFLHHTVIAH